MPLPGVLSIETAGLRAWPAVETVRDRSWVLRASGGFSKRANSVQALDPHDAIDIETRLGQAADWFSSRKLPPVFRVTPLASRKVVAALDRAQWEIFEPTNVLAADLKSGNFDIDTAVEVHVPGSPPWLTAQQHLQGYDSRKLANLSAIVGQMEAPAIGLVLRSKAGEPLASAYVATIDGMAFLGNVVTAPSERRKGHARRLVSTGLGLAALNGARFGVLQVLKANAAALALYAGLGYRLRYDYHHRRPA